MPEGADAVVMVEETDIDDGGLVSVFAPASARQNIGRQGSDIQQGQHVLQPGTLLNASRLGSIAALGVTDMAVYAKPRVAVLSTGNEIVEPGQPLAPGQIYDINRVTVSAVVGDNGGVAVPYRTASDTIEDLQRAVNECLEQDVMVFSGGSSVGERDLILDVVAARGEMLFHGIAVKPGKPTAFGRIGGKLFFGMPVRRMRTCSGLEHAHARAHAAQLVRRPVVMREHPAAVDEFRRSERVEIDDTIR